MAWFAIVKYLHGGNTADRKEASNQHKKFGTRGKCGGCQAGLTGIKQRALIVGLLF